MRKALAGLCLLFFANVLHAQQVFTGTVSDTLSRKNLTNAVVTLLHKKDSTLYQFSRTDAHGRFSMPGVQPGKYVLLVTYPKFADYADEVEVKQAPFTDAGTIPLTLKASLLDAVVIRSAGAIRIKGDTTEFVADSFKVKEGATVEELLKKMPGFQVNSKGEITAQGQRVDKVLVDGEEFFGDDPTMATKNLSAKAVDRVQVFDNKTEQQNLTGISTGTEGKTVNIKLKEDQKKGAFGKVEAGSDFKDIVDARLLYNKFMGKKKISLYGTKSNTNTGSLNWEDRRKLGFENDFEYDELSGYYYSFGTSDADFNDWSLRGIPNAYTAGALYIDRWNGDRHGINGSYRYNRLQTDNITNRLEQRVVPGSLFYVNTKTASGGLNQQHAGNFKYEWKIDSLASLKLTSAITRKQTNSLNFTTAETLTDSVRAVNVRDNNLYSTRLQSDNQLQYKQNFTKKNRLLMTTLRFGVTEDDQTGYLYSNESYYRDNLPDSFRVQNQKKINEGSSVGLGAKVTFSEPITLKWNLVAEYSYNQNSAVSHKNTFDSTGAGKYDLLNGFFSNNFDLEATSNSGSLIARYMYKKFRFAFGSGLSAIRLNLKDLDSAKTSVFHFRNLTPQASFNYTPKQQTNIGINYRGTTRQPTIDQLQPIRDNNDPMNIYTGNPGLDVGFNHNISIFYNSYKMLSGRGIWANAGYNFTEDAISQFSRVDAATGKRTYGPINVDGNNNWYLWAEWNKGEGEKKFNHTVRANANGGRNITYVNEQRNVNNYYSYEIAYGIRYEVTDKYKIYISPKGGYNYSKSSLNPKLQNNFFNYGGDAEGYIMLPGKFELSTEVNFDLRQRINAFDTNPNIILWNANISKKVFKNNSGKFTFVANDLLDKNRGFTRVINSDRVTEESFQRLSRYFLLKFEWSFTNMPGQK